MLMQAAGRYREAAELILSSRSEWARLQGREAVEDDPVFQYRLAMTEAAEERWHSAATRLRRSLALEWPAGVSGTYAQIDVGILLTEAECMQGDVTAGTARAARLREQLALLSGYKDPRWLAWLAHAEAVCAAAQGDIETALRHLAEADSLSAELAPGFATEVARRELMQAQLLLASGRHDVATEVATRGRARLLTVGLNSHPLIAQLEAIAP